MPKRDHDERVRQRCSARPRLCVQLRHQGAATAALAIAELSATGALAAHPFAAPRLVFTWPFGACARSRCVGAAALLSGARAVCTAASGFAGVAALAIAELSTTGALAARVIRLLCRGLLFLRPYGAYARSRCVGAAALLSGARAVCTAATGFAGVAALQMPLLRQGSIKPRTMSRCKAQRVCIRGSWCVCSDAKCCSLPA